MKILTRLLIILSLCALATACRSSKSATDEALSGNVAAMPLAKRVEAVAKADKPWTELNVPLKVELRSPASFSASGRLYMRRGVDVYISMRMLGIEVAVLYIDKENVYIADKFNRRYLAEPISSLLNSADLTIGDIQDAILGRVFLVGEGELTAKNARSRGVELSEQTDTWTVSTKGKSPARFDFILGKDDNVLQSLDVTVGDKTVACRYSGPAATDCGRFMSQADVDTTVKGKRIDAALKLNFSGVKFQVDPSIGWREPSGYTRIPAESVLNLLKISL